MDLLGGIGDADQLASARAENALLKARVNELQGRCSVLTLENEALKAEVEIYRNDAACSKAALEAAVAGSVGTDTHVDGGARARDSDSAASAQVREDFVKSGNGIYPSNCDVTIDRIHEMANVLCCALSPDDTIVATGGADGNVALCQWGANDPSPSLVSCEAPVISVAFGKSRLPLLAAGCMDGSVHLVRYKAKFAGLEAKPVASDPIKHTKYVKNVVWSPFEPIVVSASADGCVQFHKVTWTALDEDVAMLEKVQTLQLTGPVESMCFIENRLCCYARGTPHLSVFDLADGFAQSKINLNKGPGNAGFDDHVSFAIMDMSPDASNKYLALATDTSRNIILEWPSGRQVRNLYGHKNDGFSQPKVAWSHSGQYLIGNTQEESNLCVWDVASATIVHNLEGHTNPIRDIFSSRSTDTMVTTSFDKKTKVWLPLPTD